MDSRIQKAMEIEALEALKKTAVENTATLKSVLDRLDAIDARFDQPSRPAGTSTANTPKGGR